jgi:hypothetical protein
MLTNFKVYQIYLEGNNVASEVSEPVRQHS